MNRRRNERLRRIDDQVVRVAQRALSVIGDAVDQGDSKLALRFLTAVGFHDHLHSFRVTPETSVAVTAELGHRLQDELVSLKLVPEYALFLVEDESNSHRI